MKLIIPKKLHRGSNIRVIAPSRSMKILSNEVRKIACEALSKAGFNVSFGKHVDELDKFSSSSIKSRVNDLHDAFLDPSVDGILTTIGGYNSNQLLDYLDYNIIKKNPKYLCGYSDITVLTNAIYAKTGLVGCNGPHFSSWAIKKGFEYSKEYFKKCCMQNTKYQIKPSRTWSDDDWYLDQNSREFIRTKGFYVINPGKAEGTLVGGHLRCFACLQGTQYFPPLKNSILLLEEDEEANPMIFDRLLQSIIQLPDFNGVQGIIIGRFKKKSQMTLSVLKKIINSKKELALLPIIANVTVGHTMPIATFPIGGIVKISTNKIASITIIKH